MSVFHLAGVVPLAAPKLDFGYPWHDSMIPIGRDYLAVERSVIECAYAGCETIWVVCDDSVQPLLKKRIGDYVQDPVWINREYEKFKNNFRKRIPVYYVPTSVHDRGHRDSLGWSALHGAYVANKISKGISKKLTPDMFYISFPYGVYDVRLLKPIRKKLSSASSVFLCHNNKTVVDGEYLGFTASWQTIKNLRSLVWEKTKNNKTLQLQKKYSARDFSLSDVFGSLEDKNVELVADYYRIDSWDGYRNYLSSETPAQTNPNRMIIGGYRNRGF